MGRLPKRIVTGNDERGRSHAVINDATTRRGITAEIWRTGTEAASVFDSKVSQGSAALEPPPGGSVFRLFQIGPEQNELHLSEADREKMYASHFQAMQASHCRPDPSRHPGMHRTATLDYIVVLTGRVTLLLDNEEIELEPFDVVVQRATNHAWVNRGDVPALLMAVQIDDTEQQELQSIA
jgi:mannose-6-phosphate isomerase-like protein (cupin superfamily)